MRPLWIIILSIFCTGFLIFILIHKPMLIIFAIAASALSFFIIWAIKKSIEQI